MIKESFLSFELYLNKQKKKLLVKNHHRFQKQKSLSLNILKNSKLASLLGQFQTTKMKLIKLAGTMKTQVISNEQKKGKLAMLLKEFQCGESFTTEYRLVQKLNDTRLKTRQRKQEFQRKVQMIIFFSLGTVKSTDLILMHIKMIKQEC